MVNALLNVLTYTLIPVSAATIGGVIAAWRTPGPMLRSYIQHFAAGVIVAAAAGFEVEQPARDRGVGDRAAVIVLELDQAALAATVAQRLPFVAGQAVQRIATPELWAQAGAIDRVACHDPTMTTNHRRAKGAKAPRVRLE